MLFTTALFAGLAAAAATPIFSDQPVIIAPTPPVGEVKIISISAVGTGCPAGHAFVNIDATGTIFDVAFDQYIVTVGPQAGPTDNRKNCRVSINLQFPVGYQ